MNDDAVAYAFNSYRWREGYQRSTVSGQDVLPVKPSVASNMEPSGIIVYTTGEECRAQLKTWPSYVSIIVNNAAGDITSVNLAAALCIDDPERDVYLIEENPTEALALNARIAGIRGIINSDQAERLLTDCAKYHPPEIQIIKQESPNTGQVVGFFSGRGGVGKSTIALMSALSAQKRGLSVALVDLDLQFGDLSFLAGREPSSNIQRVALAQVCKESKLPALSNSALTLITAPEQIEQGEKYSTSIEWLLDSLAATKDLVIVNSGSFWTDVHAITIKRCTQVALLMDQRATAIEACKQVMTLCGKLQIPQASFIYLLNGCGRGAAFTPEDVSFALGGYKVLGLADGGALVDELLSLGCPHELLSSANAFVTSLDEVLDTLVVKAVVQNTQIPAYSGNSKKGKLFDLDAIRRFFEGGQRVAT